MTTSTPLRQRLIEDLQLHGFAAKTQDAYVRSVKQLAAYYHKSPDVISEEELRHARGVYSIGRMRSTFRPALSRSPCAA